MTQRLHGYPSGFLSLVGSQSFGEQPKELSEIVAPTIGLLEMYAASKQVANGGFESAFGGTGFRNALVGGVTALTVPTAELWWMRAMGLIVTCGAGVSCVVAIAVRQNGTVVPVSNSVSVAANQVRHLAVQPDLWLPPGAELGFHIGEAAGGNPVYSLNNLVSILRI